MAQGAWLNVAHKCWLCFWTAFTYLQRCPFFMDPPFWFSFILCCRAEAKAWSPTLLEDGKAQAYRVNVEAEPQVWERWHFADTSSWLIHWKRNKPPSHKMTDAGETLVPAEIFFYWFKWVKWLCVVFNRNIVSQLFLCTFLKRRFPYYISPALCKSFFLGFTPHASLFTPITDHSISIFFSFFSFSFLFFFFFLSFPSLLQNLSLAAGVVFHLTYLTSISFYSLAYPCTQLPTAPHTVMLNNWRTVTKGLFSPGSVLQRNGWDPSISAVLWNCMISIF